MKTKETAENIYNSDFVNIDGNEVHKTAIINSNVIIGTGNRIGAYTVIGSNGEIRGKDQNSFSGKVLIGNNNVISEHVTIQTPFDEGSYTKIGSNKFTTVDAKLARELRDEYANQFNTELTNALNGVSFKQDCCVDCHAQITLQTNLP